MHECACAHVGWAPSLKKRGTHTHTRTRCSVKPRVAGWLNQVATFVWPQRERERSKHAVQTLSLELQLQVEMRFPRPQTPTSKSFLYKSCVSGMRKCFASQVQIVFYCSVSNCPTCFQGQGWENSRRRCVVRTLAVIRLYSSTWLRNKKKKMN